MPYRRKFVVHSPRQSASTVVHWRSNTWCYQQHWWQLKLVDHSYDPFDISMVGYMEVC